MKCLMKCIANYSNSLFVFFIVLNEKRTELDGKEQKEVEWEAVITHGIGLVGGIDRYGKDRKGMERK